MKRFLVALFVTTMVVNQSVTAFSSSEPPADDGSITDITLGQETDTGITLDADTVLIPGETYTFPIIVEQGGAYIQFDDGLDKEFDVDLEEIRGRSALEYIKVVEGAKGFEVEIEIEKGWPTELTDVEYEIELTNNNSSKAILTGEFVFSAGYPYADQDTIDALDSGDYIEVDDDAPVYRESQLEQIAEINDYDDVIFSASNWTYRANVSGRDAVNMYYQRDVIDPVLEAFPDNDFVFLSFPAGPQFGRGTLEFDVSNIEEDFDYDMYMYRYYEGKLTQLDTDYDEDESILSTTTGNLGRFVITDKKIADGTVVEYGFGGSEEPDEPEEPEDPEPETDTIPDVKPNPESGR